MIITDFNYTNILNFYDRVRAVLGTNEKAITNEAMDYPEKATAATIRIKTLVPNWTEFILQETEEQRQKYLLFESCIVYQTAIYFYPYIKEGRIKTRQTADIKIEYSTSATTDDTGNALEEILQELLSQLVCEEQNCCNFFAFMVT